MDGVVGVARPGCLALTSVGVASAARRSQLGSAEPCCSGCYPLAICAERLADPPLSLRGSWRCTRMLCGPGDTAMGDCVGPPPSFLSLPDVWVVCCHHACVFGAVSFPRGRVVRGMMFGFGDSMPPSPASVRLMEEMVIEYIVALVTKVCFVSYMFALVVALGAAVSSFVSGPEALDVSPVTSWGGSLFASWRRWHGAQSIMSEKR